MRHRKKTVKLGRTSSHRNELLSNLVCNLILLLVYSVFLYFVVGNGVILVLVACVATAFALNPVLSKSRLLSAQITGANRQTLSKVLLILDAIRLIKLSGRENDERS